MGSTPDSVQDSLTKNDVKMCLTENTKTRKLLNIVKQCAELKQTEQSLAILQSEIDLEINECYEKSHSCLLLKLQLAEAVSDGRLDAIFGSICESMVEIRQNFEIALKAQYKPRIPEGYQKLHDLTDLAPLRQPSLKWAKKMLADDPEGLVKQLEECKKKVDAAHKYFQEFKQEMESSRESVHNRIDKAIRMSKSLMQTK
ncbi:unnamed protein product [Orchesella dallaii]|uniref:Uncharacterized protein n=1 Tax=Orchesella dallaii TaxID=48710 RepID=A0ABP1QR70_9HEXA